MKLVPGRRTVQYTVNELNIFFASILFCIGRTGDGRIMSNLRGLQASVPLNSGRSGFWA